MKLYWRKFGCEFEFSSDFEEVSRVIKYVIPPIYGNRIRITRRWYRSTNNTRWHLKIDTSTSSELATPVSTYDDLPKIKKVLRGLKRAKISLSRHDSAHFHMQADDIAPNNIIVAWLQIERALLRCFPKHRRKNDDYCDRLMDGPRNHDLIAKHFCEAEDRASEHHRSMSLNRYKKIGTVEFRLSEGIIDGNVMEMWVKFYMLFLHYAKTINPMRIVCSSEILNDVNSVIDLLEIKNGKVADFLCKRYRMFK